MPGTAPLMLVRVGFTDGAAAEQALAGPVLEWWDAAEARPVDAGAATAIAALGRSADPDAALAALVRLVEAASAIGADARPQRSDCGRTPSSPGGC